MSKRVPGYKEHKYLYQKMLSEDVIRRAFRKLRKGKSKRPEIQRIEADFDNEVKCMQEMILNTKPPDIPVPNPEKAYRPHKRHPGGYLNTENGGPSASRKSMSNGSTTLSSSFWSQL